MVAAGGAPEPAIRPRMAARLCSSASTSTSTHAGRRAAARSSAARLSSEGRRSRSVAIESAVLEAGGFAEEGEVDRAGLAVSVLGDDQLGEAAVLVRRAVDLVAVDEGDHISILLDRPRLA